MHIDIHLFRIDLNLQYRKRITVAHHKRFVSILDCPGNDRALHITPIDKIILVIPVSPGNHRLSDKAANPDISIIRLRCHQICSDIPSVNAVNNILQITVAGRVQLRIPIADEFKRDVRMRQRHAFQQIAHIACLGRC